jgi:hypothetical protein
VWHCGNKRQQEKDTERQKLGCNCDNEKKEDNDLNPIDCQEKLLTELARFADLGKKGYKYVLYFSYTQTQ